MKVWITRPSIWDVMVDGVRRCEVWLEKPYYDRTPMGPIRDSLCPKSERGWRIKNGACRLSAGLYKHFESYPELKQDLWIALCFSIDGQEPNFSQAHWSDSKLWKKECDEDGYKEFLYECEIPPELWVKIMFDVGSYEAQYAKDKQTWFFGDIPF